VSVEIAPEFSAVANRPAPRSIRILAPEIAAEGDRVVDLGCGFMAGTRELLLHHAGVYAVDTGRQKERIRTRLADCERKPNFRGFRSDVQFGRMQLRLRVAYVVNVLHTIPNPAARIELLKGARRNLIKDGTLVLDVPASEGWYSSRMTAERRYSDGYVFHRPGQAHTFYRFCSEAELDAWAHQAGFRFERKVVVHHHRVRVYRAS
jgi:SAM-dependent methyltransferase